MITLYAHGSPNPHKISIALEELELPYETKIVNIHEGEQLAPDFLVLNPNAKVPVVVDRDSDQTVYESNAILLYLAEKTGRLPPALAYGVTGFELVAGALLIAGVGVRVVALLAIPLLLGTIVTVHGANGWEFQNEGGGWEYPAFLIVACAVSATLGAGGYSLARVIGSGASVLPRKRETVPS